jgi:thiamine-phosphate pyrophosphorylase
MFSDMLVTIPRVYPITDTAISGLSHATQVERLVDGGATLIQLREKKLPPRAFYDDALKALEIARSNGVKIIINDRVDVALALDADGVHLGQADLSVEAARRLAGSKLVIGYSTHNVEQVQAALHLPIDYLAFGPIYATSSKEKSDPVAGLKELPIVRSLAGRLPLVAIGGINATNLRDVLDAGADSVAIISAIVGDPGRINEKLRHLMSLAEIPT